MDIIGKSKIWFVFSGMLCTLSIIFLIIWGLKPGIDFTGGSLLRVEFTEQKLSNDQIREVFSDTEQWGSVTSQEVGNKEFIVRLKTLDEAKHQEALQKLQQKLDESTGGAENPEISSKNLVKEIKFDSIGPSIGRELRQKSTLSVIFVLLAIVAYIAWAFRGVATGISKYESFIYGLFALVALLHDVLVVLGLFAFLGHFYNVEVDTFFIAALLTILGYSVNDTIIIFDRIRENM